MLRVGVATNRTGAGPAGVTVAVETLRSELARRQTEALLLAPGRNGIPGRWSEEHRVPAIPGLSVNGCASAWPFARVPRPRMDLLHLHHPYGFCRRAARSAARRGIPLLYTLHTRFEHYAHYVGLPPRLVAWWISRRLRELAQLGAWATAPTAYAAAELARHGFRRVVTLPWTAGRRFYAAKPSAALRERTRTKRVALYAGRLAREKDVPRLVAAFAWATRGDADWGLAVAGDGPERALAERAVCVSGIGERTVFLGAIPHADMPDLVASADLAISASVTETQGLSLTEAMAAGVPVVTARFPGAGEIVPDGRAGVVVSQALLPGAIRSATSRRDLRARLAAGARAHARGTHPLRWSETVMQTYRALIHEIRRPA